MKSQITTHGERTKGKNCSPSLTTCVKEIHAALDEMKAKKQTLSDDEIDDITGSEYFNGALRKDRDIVFSKLDL